MADIVPVWQRQPHETNAAFNAFHEHYLTQDNPRSVDEAWRGYKGLTKGDKKRPPLSFRRWSQGAKKDGTPIEGALPWQARAAAYDDYLAQLREAEFEKRHMGTVEALARLADIARASHADFVGVNIRDDLEGHPMAHVVKTVVTDTYEDAKGKIHHKMKLELHPALAAIEDILKIHGKFKDTVTNLNYDLSKATDEQLQRIAAGEDPATVLQQNPTTGGG